MNRSDFPYFSKTRPIYLDSAATSLKPAVVIDAITGYYTDPANIGRSNYTRAGGVTAQFAAARATVAHLINCRPDEIIFTSSATASLNTVMHFLQPMVGTQDTIALTPYEHNSNYLPWVHLAHISDCKLNFLAHDQPTCPPQTKLFSYALADNVTGCQHHFPQFTKAVHQADGWVAIDASQAISHYPVDVKQLDCDFLAFSGHKLYAPTGIGVLYVRRELQAKLTPVAFGSETFSQLDSVHHQFTLLNTPAKFEPGTPHIAGAIGLATAIDYLNNIGWDNITTHFQTLKNTVREQLAAHDLARYCVGYSGTMLSLAKPHLSPHDITMLLSDNYHINTRGGRLCNDLYLQHLNLPSGVVRASFGIYTTSEEIAQFCAAYSAVIEELA